jgi:hypothetical protein
MTHSITSAIRTDRQHPSTHPRLKLFLSADIIGSTAYKQPLDIRKRSVEDDLRWEWIIQGFYKEFRSRFQVNWDDMAIAGKPKVKRVLKGPRPVFWKTIGDEVVFWKELTGDLQVWLTLSAWLKTIADVRQWFKDTSGGQASQLDIKATVWVAGFPIRNKAVVPLVSVDSGNATGVHEAAETAALEHLNEYYREAMPETFQERVTDGELQKHPKITHDVDFIGPGIDVGFRLCGFSSSKKMSISLDCAYLMALTIDEIRHFQSQYRDNGQIGWDFFPTDCGPTDRNGTALQSFEGRLAVFFSGDDVLKGVLGGIQYPKFWINNVRSESLESARDAFYQRSRPTINWAELKTYCEKFYDDRAKFIARPFINNMRSIPFRNLSTAHVDFHKEHVKRVLRASKEVIRPGPKK